MTGWFRSARQPASFIDGVVENTHDPDRALFDVIVDPVAAVGKAADRRRDPDPKCARLGMLPEQLENTFEAPHIGFRNLGSETLNAVMENIRQIGCRGSAKADFSHARGR